MLHNVLYDTAAKIEIYSRIDVRYRIDSLTGERVSSTSTYYLIYKLYVEEDGGYLLYNTWESAKHN